MANDLLNAPMISVTALCLIGLATQLPTIQSARQKQAAIAATQSERVRQGDLLSAEQAAQVVQRDIANERYDSGVEIVATLRNAKVAATIQEGKPIVAGAYATKFDPKKPNPDYYLGRDVVVGDCYGTTAITRFDASLGYAVASSIAVTNDRERMAKACNARQMQRPNLVK